MKKIEMTSMGSLHWAIIGCPAVVWNNSTPFMSIDWGQYSICSNNFYLDPIPILETGVFTMQVLVSNQAIFWKIVFLDYSESQVT